ncbi:MAG: hypothetical protein FJ399_19505 [Verrucomicrobia bacterium]|nr:hypothetical protein [Verrucomicrobiota bacterium]
MHITDWMPTLAAVAGAKPERDLQWDGTSLLSLLTAHAPLPDRPLYSVAPGWRSRSLRFGPWKLIVFGEGASRRAELYHLAADPHEKNNLASAQPDRLRQLQGLLDQAAARDRDAIAKDK